jgi:hypothetical protein
MAPGIVVVAQSGLVFEAPEGRVVIVEARGGTSIQAVLNWYREAMPALGWTVSPRSGSAFAPLELTRGRERLEIDVGPGGASEPAANTVTARFRFVAPGPSVSP